MSIEVLKLVDPEGSELLIGRVGSEVYTIAANFVNGQPFRMFEEDRAKLRAFLRALVG